MKIRLGYVSIPKTINITSSHTITYSNYEKIEKELGKEHAYNKIINISKLNIYNLEQILKYNIRNNIHFYRMSSNIFPLATHPKINIDILKILKKELKNIGKIINNNKIRVDIHLDQFCVLNSINKEIVKSTINIINFHKNMLNAMNLKTYMIIHIGSNVFGKENSIKRFINNFNLLDKEAKKMIIIENDDKIFNIKDTLYISKMLKIPMVLDYHHYICNNDGEKIEEYIEEIIKTWNNKTPKMHISSQKNKKEFRSHNDYINIEDFINLLDKIKYINKDIDIMIEAKEKDIALFKLIRELKYRNYNFIDETTMIVKKRKNLTNIKKSV